jgi:hypothetical protein
MAILFSGSFTGKAVKAELGSNKQGKPTVRWEMEVVEGEHKGKRAQYSGKFDAQNIKFTKRDMMSIGWQGKDAATFVEDVTKASAIVPFEAEIVEFDRADGSKSSWTAARMTGGAPLAPLDRSKLSEVNQWFAEADGSDSTPF